MEICIHMIYISHRNMYFIWRYIFHMETVRNFIFWAPKSLQRVTDTMKLKDACSLEEKL